MAEALRVAVVDDHPVFRLGMVGLLDSLSGIEVVVQAESEAEALERIRDQVDVVLMDLHLGEDSGIETTRALTRRWPDIAVLVITMDEADESVAAAIRAGARGYLLKSASPEQVERGIRAVADGEVIMGPQVAARAMANLARSRVARHVPFPELSDREREILDLLARGYDNTSIARRLVLSPKTVRNHVSNVLTKINADDRASALIRARQEGLGGD